MPLARVVTFEGVSSARVEELKAEISNGEQPEEIPATEVVLLHDPEAETSVVILFFETEDDYMRADETLSAMPPGDTPGRRTSVGKYQVAIRKTS
ncbi:MAG TPA: hypothetical protein VFX15_15540 [Actinomycetes bacterium]|nr:hypothetical protein [Actinomycetes bacterium]